MRVKRTLDATAGMMSSKIAHNPSLASSLGVEAHDVLAWQVAMGVEDLLVSHLDHNHQPRPAPAPKKKSLGRDSFVGQKKDQHPHESDDVSKSGNSEALAENREALESAGSMENKSAAPVWRWHDVARAETVPDDIRLDGAVDQARAMAERSHSIAELAQAVDAYQYCPLRKTAKNTVFVDGVFDAEILIIGEAPGADEDDQGKPFVGRAGRLLDNILASIDLDRNRNVLITNTVYWRPPMNRPPLEDERLMCAPFMQRLLALQAPKLILLLGATALSSYFRLSGNVVLKKHRRQWYRGDGLYAQRAVPHGDDTLPQPFTPLAQTSVLVSYHPAYLLRQPSAKASVWRDMLMFSGKSMALKKEGRHDEP